MTPQGSGGPGADSRTRQKILRTTLDWAAETGLLQLSMNGVAKRARIARATLYLHFPGKQALFDAVMDHQVTEIMTSVRNVIDAYDTTDDRVVHGFAHAYRLTRANTVLQAVLRINPEELAPHIIGAAPTLDRGREFVVAMTRSGDLPPHLDANMVGDFAIRLLQTLVVAPPVSFDLDRPGGPEHWARCFLLPVVHSEPPPAPG